MIKTTHGEYAEMIYILPDSYSDLDYHTVSGVLRGIGSPDANGKRDGFYHMVKNKDYGAKFSQIMYFRPAWSRGGGMTITFWKTLNNQELQRVQQIMANETFENGITPFVQKIDSVLLKQNQ